MTRTLLLGLAAALLWGCATHPAKAPPICDGRHLRPANPYGSVLQSPMVGPPAALLAPQAAPAPDSASPPAGDHRPDSGGCGS